MTDSIGRRGTPLWRRISSAVATAVLASLVGSPSATLAAVAPACPQVGTTVTCTYISGDNVFTVPSGVTTVHVTAAGAPGGTLRWNNEMVGGRPAVVTADLSVTPQQTLHAMVGGYPTGSHGGFNGGGDGAVPIQTITNCLASAGGGGASDVRTGTGIDSRVLIAAGGGGAGCEGFFGLANGGQTGGDAGTAGISGVPMGGLAGGGGGQAGCSSADELGCGKGGASAFSGQEGEDGALGVGGGGGVGGQATGGGGGAGYYGGGGGGGGASDAGGDSTGGGGGGGGSSLVPVGGTVGVDTTGVPKIEISFSAPALPAGPHATLAPASIDFGDVVVGQQAAPQSIHLTSSGLGDLDISSIGFDGPSDGFELGTNDCGAVLPSQWTCSINVWFATSSVGPHSAILSIDDDAADSPQTVTLMANGVGGTGPLVSIAPASLDFGDQAVGTKSAPRTVTITNVGTLPIFANAAIPAPAQGFAESSNCISVEPGDSCEVTVTFTPPALGPASAQLAIFDPMPNSPQLVGLTGVGVPAVPAAHLDTTALSFGNQAVGGTTGSQTVTLSNPGSGPLAVATVLIGGSNAGDFGEGTDTCSGTSVAPGSSCTFSVSFSPTARGSRSASLQFTDNAGDSPQSVSLSGTGFAPVDQLSVTSIDFGSVEIGATSAHRRLTITNAGDAGQNLLLTSETITGLNRSEFAFAGDTCITNFIAPGSSCTIDLTFTPSAAGLRSATLTLSDNGVGGPHTVSLSGTGVTASADLAVSIAASPNPVKTGTKVTYTITILNAGPSTAKSILINDSLSSQSTFVSATISQGFCVTPVKGASGVVSCSLGSLASGASQPIQVMVTVIAKKNSITTTVSVSAATTDPNLANNSASITTRVK